MFSDFFCQKKIGKPERENDLLFFFPLPSPWHPFHCGQTEWVSSLCTWQMIQYHSLIRFIMHPTERWNAERWKGHMQFHASLGQFKAELPNSTFLSAPVHPPPFLVPELSRPRTNMAKKVTSFWMEKLRELVHFLVKHAVELACAGLCVKLCGGLKASRIASCTIRTRSSSWVCCGEDCL